MCGGHSSILDYGPLIETHPDNRIIATASRRFKTTRL